MTNDGGRTPEVLVDGMAFPENPRWRDGALYLSDHRDKRVFQLRDGELRPLCDVPAGVSGLGWTPDGALLLSSMQDRRLLRLEDDGSLAEVADLSPLVGGPVNDMVVDAHGRTYIGNFGSFLEEGEPLMSTVLVRVDPDGSARVVTDGLVFPNGTAVSADGRTLVVAETFALRLTAFDVAPDGGLSNRRTFAAFGPETAPTTLPEALAIGGPMPDGIALDAEGAVWMADPRGPAVLRVAEGGEVLERVPTGELGSYAVALGGEDRRTLFICANIPLGPDGTAAPGMRAGAVLACRVEVPGAGLP